MKIGTQTFGLKKDLSEDFFGTIRKLHDIGFDAVEPLILLQEKQGSFTKNLWSMELLIEAQRLMKEFDMEIPSVHIGFRLDGASMSIESIIRGIVNIQERTNISVFVISGLFGDPIYARLWGELLKEIAKGVSAYGCTILYHNHDSEFNLIDVDGHLILALDYFFEQAGPDVLLQLDIGWAGFAGDEVLIAKHYAERIASLHLKDLYSGFRTAGYTRLDIPDEQFAPIGEGSIKTMDILAMYDKFSHGNGSIIIDQDKYSGDMLKALKTGYGNCRKLLGIEERYIKKISPTL